MAHPHRAQAKSSKANKFKAITGKSHKGAPFAGGRMGSDDLASAMGVGNSSPGQMPEGGMGAPPPVESGMPMPGMKSGGRLDKRARGGAVGRYADGGRTKKGNNVTINIVSPKSPPDGSAPAAGAGPMVPPVGPPGGGIPPILQAAIAAKAAGAGGPPPGPMPMPPPGAPPAMKKGGRVKVEGSKKDERQDKKLGPKHGMSVKKWKAPEKKATGGGVGHKYPEFKSGAGTGPGRNEKASKYGLKPLKAG